MIFPLLLFLHSLLRWLLLLAMLSAVIAGMIGYKTKLVFTSRINALRHWTATIAHVQLMIGILVWSQSALVKDFLKNHLQATGDSIFFGLIHVSGMLVAIVLLTIGSAKAKRADTDREKFRIMFLWFGSVLLMILLMIPWPFSPLASRPVFRAY